MKILAVANLKGGAGKTTSAVTIADALSGTYGLNVLVVDLDPQGTLSAWTAGRAEGARELLLGNFNPSEHVAAVHDRLHVIPANRSLERANDARPSDLAKRLERLWGAVSGYDVCLVDTPPQAGKLVTAALLSVDGVICPVAPGRGSVDGLLHLQDYASRIGGAGLVGAFAVNVDLRSKLHKAVPEQIIDRLGRVTDGGTGAETFVRSTVQMQEAEAASELPSSYCPSSTAWEDYCSLTDELFDLTEPNES
jgi:chromosome partitioning protein